MSQGRGNRGFAASLVDQVTNDVDDETSPAEAVLASRSSSLSRLATGKVVTDRTEYVDPARCRPWRLHNRELEKLNEDNCADLIEAFKSAGKQRIPAIVRRVRDDPSHDYEIIAGVRRWWTVQYLREHHHPEFDYLVTIQNMTDEESFRVADLENRARRDISPMERALDYLRAIDEFYDGSQDTMAERLNVSKSWMSRVLDVGRLPAEIVAAFADSHEITVRMARDIAPLARVADARVRMVKEASRIQDERQAGGEIEAAAVVKRLVASAQRKSSAKKTDAQAGEIKTASGKPMIKYTRAGRGGGLTIRLLPRSGATKGEIVKAVEQLLDD